MDAAQGLASREVAAIETENPVVDNGSFRDPSGFVCHWRGQVYRAVDADCRRMVDALRDSGLLERLKRGAGLLETRTVARQDSAYNALRRAYPDVADFLWHTKVPFISYPYEWTTTMLADAAIACLDLQMLLVQAGHTLKDASAYNIQFLGARTAFIDIPSIARTERRDIWMALDQFYRMFLYPLLLARRDRTSIKEYFLAHLDGLEPAKVFRRFGAVGAFAAAPLDLGLPHILQRLVRNTPDTLRERVERRQDNAGPLLMNLRRLRRKLQRLGAKKLSGGRWSDYAENNSYDHASESAKRAFVADCLASARPARVLDCGCNTGEYSVMAARAGAKVVAIDADAPCVDRLYRKARAEKLDILPLVVDLANPSPGIGYRGVERTPFEKRARFDAVFALALVHHLLISARLPLAAIRELFAALTTRFLVVEYVDPADPMFISVLGAGENLYGGLTPERFVAEFEERFALRKQAAVGNHRILYLFEKRS